jgi:hypothetical protein
MTARLHDCMTARLRECMTARLHDIPPVRRAALFVKFSLFRIKQTPSFRNILTPILYI